MADESRWTVETIKEHFDVLRIEHDKRHERSEVHTEKLRLEERHALNISIQNVEQMLSQALESQKIAIEKAEGSMTRRLESLNELRQTMADQATKFVTRVELDAKTEHVEGDVADLKNWRNQQQGQAAGKETSGARAYQDRSTLISVVAIIVSIVAVLVIFVRH
jgi:hypothetical protein